jgi:glycosyltransferase involved in cell wall biosynthesis
VTDRRRPRVLVVCAGPVLETLTGVAIRAVELARVLSEHAEVTVAGTAPSSPREDVPVVEYKLLESPRRSPLGQLIREADFIVAQPPWPIVARWLRQSSAQLIYDLYDPEPFEIVELLRDRRPLLRRLVYTLTVDRVLDGLADADHLMCASEKQRDLWIGALLATRRITPQLYDADPTLRRLIDCVPFGLPDVPPRDDGTDPIRRRFPEIAPDDEIVLWNGGIWAWLDAGGAIRAFELLRTRRPQAKLVFMGAATLPAARAAEREARELAEQLGLLDRQVFFNDEWVGYEQRAGWLLRASCAISTHGDHLETRFAFRTRMLDALWAGLPIVCTAGDDFADRVETEHLGAAVPAGDAAALADALVEVLGHGREHYRAKLEASAARQTWPRLAAPLIGWVTDPELRVPATRAERGLLHRGRTRGFDLALGALSTLGIS